MPDLIKTSILDFIARYFRNKQGDGLQLDFIVSCRMGKAHNYDIVEGPMADDTIFNYVQNFVDGKISREAFWSLAKFKRPTHQISFHTARALTTLKFLQAREVKDDE